MLLVCFACAALAHAAGIKLQPVSLPKGAVTAGTKALPVNVSGDSKKELVLVEGQTMSILRLEGDKYVPQQKLTLPSARDSAGKTYYGFGRLDLKAPYSILLLQPDGIYYYPLEGGMISDQPRILLKKPLIQGQASDREPQYFDFALDLDNDGLDDLLLPEARGFSIYHQTAPRQFSPVRLPRDPYKQTDTFNFQRLLPDDRSRVPSISGYMSRRSGVNNLLLFDANSDGLEDLIYTTTLPGPNSKEIDRYDIFLQRRDCEFTTQPSQSMAVPYEHNADVTFRDLNRDGRLDAIVIKSNLDIVNPKTQVKFYMAGKDSSQIFARESDRFVTKDPIGIVCVADFNNDRYIDFAVTYFSYQFSSVDDIVDFVLSNKLRFRLQFFLGRGSAGFNRQPDYQKELQLSMKTESYRGYPPIMITDDMNGDKIMDLVVRTEEDKLAVYPSSGNFSYEKDPSDQLTIPEDAVVNFDDVNADGLTDIIISSIAKPQVTVYLSTPK
ncbi:MAG: VCBS repeat-containing protein [bacterium]|nr:VCBS repeat-containing protein [Candidatus Sumerlaeota bacterium]